MRILATTDDRYLGSTLPDNLSIGDMVSLGDFQFEVQFIHQVEAGNVILGYSNYQIECEAE